MVRATFRGLVFLSGACLGGLLGCEDEGGEAASLTDVSLPDVGDAAPFLDLAIADARADPADAAPGPDVPVGPDAHMGEAVYTLTVLHTGNGESALLPTGGWGGAAYATTVLRDLQDAAAEGDGAGRLTVTSGDNFEAGPVFAASLGSGPPFYDTVALGRGRYDAMTLGNHDFDFGPQTLADFVGGFEPAVPFLSANLDFAPEPMLQALVDAGRIAPWVIVETGGAPVGVVGATTDTLPVVSSPGGVEVAAPLEGVRAAVEALTAEGVDKIVLVSHLASIEDEVALLAGLSDVDVVVAGGGDDVLANEGDALAGDDLAVDPYPRWARDADGRRVPLVTTSGQYRYVGRLRVTFDAGGRVLTAEGGPVRVASADQEDAVDPDPEVERAAIEPLGEALDALAGEHVGFSEVPLHGRRRDLRRRETNLGDLVADALRWQAADFVFGTEVAPPEVGLMNGGGIRNNSILPPGVITALNTFEILPFASFVTVLPDVSRETLRAVIENAVSLVEDDAGRFAQVSGIRLVWDPVAAPGERVVRLELDDGTVLVEDGEVVEGATVGVATIDFLARGGDGYGFGDATRVTTGVTYQAALSAFIGGALEGEITATDYPVEGAGRITKTE